MAHSHGTDSDGGKNERRLFWVATATGLFMVVEAIAGLLTGSLALVADAGHMLADVVGLVLAWFAFRVARWPADWRRTYGFDRLQILVAFGNGLALFAIAAFIIYEAIRRLSNPVEVLGAPMLVVAAAGLLINVVAYFILHGADRDNLNMRGAMVHVLGDLLGSAGAILAALVILLTGWTAADPLLSILVALIVLRSAYFVVRDSAHILLEGAPVDVAVEEIANDLQANIAGIDDIHHVHIWSITQKQPMATLHARIDPSADGYAVVRAIKERLHDKYGIVHATVETEVGDCADSSTGHAAESHEAHAH